MCDHSRRCRLLSEPASPTFEIGEVSQDVFNAHEVLVDAKSAYQSAKQDFLKMELASASAEALEETKGKIGRALSAVLAAEKALAQTPSVTLPDLALKVGAATEKDPPLVLLQKCVAGEVKAAAASYSRQLKR